MRASFARMEGESEFVSHAAARLSSSGGVRTDGLSVKVKTSAPIVPAGHVGGLVPFGTKARPVVTGDRDARTDEAFDGVPLK